MKWLILFSLLGLVVLASCLSSGAEVHHVKDLDDDMIDLKAYHQNLGEALVNKNQDIAAWLSHDMDSVLQLMSKMFTVHRKLQLPFGEHYRKRLKPYMKAIITSVDKEDWPSAIKAYQTLTRKCNDCHIDHDIDKEVRDFTK